MSHINRHFRVGVLIMGSVVVSLWTLVRFWNTASIFDLVGQQLLTRQWLQGHVSYAYIGTTNYIWKMIALYAPVELLPGSPRLKLILLTIGVNILTYVLLVLVLEKILRECHVKPTRPFYVGMLWLTTIAGSVFWVQFTNSRNLEVIGGLWLAYLVLRMLHRGPSWRETLVVAGFGTILFFSDPIQVYMTALPLLAYAGIAAVRKKVLSYRFVVIAAVIGAAYFGSKLIVTLVVLALGLHIVSGPGLAPLTSYTAATWAHDALDTGRAFIQMYGGGIEVGRLAQIVNIVTVVAVLAAAADYVRHGNRRVLGLAAVVIGVDTVVYVLSGQALLGSTSRYLIMTMPMALLLFGLAGTTKLRPVLVGLTAAAIVINALGLGVVSLKTVAHRFAPDAHLAVAAAFADNSPYKYAYASMDTAIPASYYYQPRHTILPLNCANGQLSNSYLFYDRDVFRSAERGYDGLVPLILNGSSIRNYPNVCDEAAIERQLGAPLGIQRMGTGDDVLLYPAAALRGLQ